MDVVVQHIAAYFNAPFDENGEAWGKISALKVLEEFLPDGRILTFFLTIIADPKEYDMARVLLLKLLETDPFPEARRRIGECVATAFPGEENWTVRCWLGRAVAAYTDIPGTREIAIACVLNQSEYEDVRHNCLSGLNVAEPMVLDTLKLLAIEDSTLGIAARRQLEKLSTDSY